MKKLFLFLYMFLICSLVNAQRIPDLEAIDSIAQDDLLYAVDVSDTTDSTGGTGKKATIAQVKTAIDTGATTLTGLSDVSYATQGAGRLLVSDGTDFSSVAVTGDATLSGEGAVDISNVTGNFSVGTSDFFVNDSTGNVGIGTTGPSMKLDVMGTIQGYIISSTGAQQQIDNGAGGATIKFSGANIGIGTDSPVATLHVGDGTPETVGADDLYVANDLEVDGLIYGDGSNISGFLFQDADNDTKIINELTADDDNLRFNTAGASAMTITNQQRVGIGTSTPTSILDVTATTPVVSIVGNSGQVAKLSLFEVTAERFKIYLDGSDNNSYIESSSGLNLNTTDNNPVFIGHGNGIVQIGGITGTLVTANTKHSFWNASGIDLTFGRNDTTVTASDNIGTMYFYVNDSDITTQNIAAKIAVTAAQTIASDSTGADIVISTTSTVVSASPTERLKINDSGEVEVLSGGFIPDKVTSDPCGTGYPEGSIFYNDTSNYMCYCNGSADVKMSDDITACF